MDCQLLSGCQLVRTPVPGTLHHTLTDAVLGCRVAWCPPKIRVYPEPQNVLLLGNKFFTDVIS